MSFGQIGNPDTPCHYCGQPADAPDHVVPRALGGEDVRENIVPACRSCNGRKGARWSTCSCTFCFEARRRALTGPHSDAILATLRERLIASDDRVDRRREALSAALARMREDRRGLKEAERLVRA